MVIRSQIESGGPGELTCAVIHEMVRRGYNVVVATGGGALVGNLKENKKICVHVLPQLLTGNRTIVHNIEAVSAIRRLLLKTKINKVCGMNSGATLVAYIAGHLLRNKIVYVNELFGSGKEYLHKYMPFIHLVASDSQKEKLMQEYGFTAEQLEINYPSTLDFNVWNPEKCDSCEFRQKLRIPHNHIVIGSAMMNNKGSVNKWRVVQFLLRKYSYVDFIFLGTSSRFQLVLDRLNGELGVERIHSLGLIDRPLVPIAMNAMDIFSHYLDPNEYETFGMSITEAMSMETPVVASAIGGITDMIIDDINGYLVNSEEEYISRITRLIESRELRTQMGKNARKIAKEKFSVERHVDVIEEILERQLVASQ